MNDLPSPATRPRAVIADDERLMREQLRARLGQAWPELEIVAEARNGVEAIEQVRAWRPDVIFLDIRMPGMDGIAAAREIARLGLDDDDDGGDDDGGADTGGDGGTATATATATTTAAHDSATDDTGVAAPRPRRPCEIVFITAYDEYAVAAFEQGALDYVLKPAERERLERTAQRVRERLARPRGAAADAGGDGGTPALQQTLQRLAAQLRPGGPGPLRWIQASVGQAIQMIPVDDVLFFISDEKYTRVQTATLEALIRKPIRELADELDASVFWQIHRSTLVNSRHVAAVSRDLRGRQIVTMRGHPERLEVSRSFTGLFKAM